MKKLVLSLAILMSASLGVESLASTGIEDVKLSTLKDARFRLAFNSEGSRSLIYIKDEGGRIIYTETVPKNNSYVKIFDFSTLGDGKYTLEVASGKQRVAKPFEISTNTVRSVVAIAD